MIILRTRRYSFNGQMITKIVEKLDKDRVEDYEVVKKIPSDVISISSDLNSVCIFIPKEYEYSQYDIDDFIRSLSPILRTRTSYDRNIFVMKLNTSLKLDQFCKIVKYISEEWEFCSIVED